MALKFYQSNLSPFATRVRILAYAKGVRLESLSPPGGLKSPEFLAINPLGKVPCLDHDGAVLPESEIVCEYLEDAFPTPTLRPVDPQARARVRLLSRMGDLYIAPHLQKLIGQLRSGSRDAGVADEAVSGIAAALAQIAHFLEGPVYAVGGRLSLADCTLAPLLFLGEAFLAPAFGFPSPLPDKMKTYYTGVQKDSHVGRGLAEMRAALEERMKQQAGG